MANIIDELVITLGLDSKDFSAGEQAITAAMDKLTQVMEKVVAAYEDGEKKTGEALEETGKNADKTAKGMEAAGKKAASFFSSIRGQVLALAGVTLSLSGLKNMLTSLTGKLTQLATNADAFGMSAKRLDGWSKAAVSVGSSADEIVGSFARINDAKAKLKAGEANDPIVQELMKITGQSGLSIDFANESTEDIVKKIVTAFPRLNKDQQQAYGSNLNIGYSLQQAFASGKFLNKVDEFTDNSGVNDNAIEITRRWQHQWTKTSQSFEKIQIQLMEALAPHLDKFNQWLEDLAKWMSSNPDVIKKAVNDFLDTIQQIITVANEAAGAVGGWQNAILLLVGAAVGGKLISMFHGISGSLLGPAGLIAALVALRELVIKPLEDKYPALKDNPVADFLNELPGSDTVEQWGKDFHDWFKDTTGIALPRADGYGQDENKPEVTQVTQITKSNATEVPEVANVVNTSTEERRSLEESRKENDRILRLENERQQRLEYSNNWLKTTLDKLTDSIEKLINALPGELIPQQSFVPTITPPSDGKTPRGIRNNNPGNLNFAGQRGAVKEGGENGRFAVFSTMQEGIAALYRQLQLYFGRGINTISSIVKKYAPVADGNKVDAYITVLTRKLGIDANQKIDTANVQQIIDLMEGIIRHENGAGYINRNDIIMSLPQPGALMAAQSRQPVTNSHSTVTDSIHINTLKVSSNASSVKSIVSDARGIGRSHVSLTSTAGMGTT
ncbi:lytic transglycosylase domain-containing protein [Xenorhabdus bovienii]|uniref:lytic transglycosylase domain-containing protein n=1 Tax=Xenorhabdus bovienii TaxID=40576 RepID=UPI0023B25007|nr:lytic transglycosylase domain-containing protein [Xenorhabdus bovienii]MDE9536107.1 lytic transglycosylase domain-containing protein [Xenorhabdus bovienii]MDE9589532.1 lytic transglycosylase domain-containing protein [Xenorhabdus bovienii]